MINHKNKHELKPCPFCGGNDLDVTQWIECNGCGAFGPTPGDDGDLSAWNKLKGVVIDLPEFDEPAYHSPGSPNQHSANGYNQGIEAVCASLTDAGVSYK